LNGRAPARLPILTIGHSTHSPEEFLDLLGEHGVELLIDVRRFPGSRHVPWTRADDLEKLLKAADVDYCHLESLGGRRRPSPDSPNDGWRVAQFQGYADHMGSEEFQAGLGRLEEEARDRLSVLMCAEAQWWRCHRRLLADILTLRGRRVLHLDGRGGSREHSLTEFAVVRGQSIHYPAQS
jgi:uncharacterized protein (DUF488 family)